MKAADKKAQRIVTDFHKDRNNDLKEEIKVSIFCALLPIETLSNKSHLILIFLQQYKHNKNVLEKEIQSLTTQSEVDQVKYQEQEDKSNGFKMKLP